MTQQTQDWKNIKAYWVYLMRYKWRLGIGFVLIPVIALFHLIQPLLIQRGIDQNILKGDFSGLIVTCVFFGVCTCGEFIARALQSFIFQFIGQKTVTKIRYDIFDHVLRLSPSYFDRTPKGAIK